MANNPTDGPTDDFLEQILGFPAYAGAGGGTDTNLAPGNDAAALVGAHVPMMLQLSSGDGSAHLGGLGVGVGVGLGVGVGGVGLGVHGAGAFHGGGYPLGLSLEQGKGGFMKMDGTAGSGKRFRDDIVDNRAASSSLKPVCVRGFTSFFFFCPFGCLVKRVSERNKK